MRVENFSRDRHMKRNSLMCSFSKERAKSNVYFTLTRTLQALLFSGLKSITIIIIVIYRVGFLSCFVLLIVLSCLCAIFECYSGRGAILICYS